MIAEADNADELAHRITECYEMPSEELKRMGNLGLEYSKKNYDMNTVFGNIEKVLEGIQYAK